MRRFLRPLLGALVIASLTALPVGLPLLLTSQAQTPAPSLEAVVHQVADSPVGRSLLQTNTLASCTEFTQRVLAASGSSKWGHVGKTAGEGQGVPVGFPPFQPYNVCSDGTIMLSFGTLSCPAGASGPYQMTGVSYDAIKWMPTGETFDLLGNATANEPGPWPHGPATPQWGVIPRENWRPNNPWLAAVPLSGAPPVEPPPVCPVCPGVAHPAYPGDQHGTAIMEALFADYAEAGQGPNTGMGVWAWRTAWDAAAEGMPTEASIKKHRNEWRAILGLAPIQ